MANTKSASKVDFFAQEAKPRSTVQRLANPTPVIFDDDDTDQNAESSAPSAKIEPVQNVAKAESPVAPTAIQVQKPVNIQQEATPSLQIPKKAPSGERSRTERAWTLLTKEEMNDLTRCSFIRGIKTSQLIRALIVEEVEKNRQQIDKLSEIVN